MYRLKNKYALKKRRPNSSTVVFWMYVINGGCGAKVISVNFRCVCVRTRAILVFAAADKQEIGRQKKFSNKLLSTKSGVTTAPPSSIVDYRLCVRVYLLFFLYIRVMLIKGGGDVWYMLRPRRKRWPVFFLNSFFPSRARASVCVVCPS